MKNKTKEITKAIKNFGKSLIDEDLAEKSEIVDKVFDLIKEVESIINGSSEDFCVPSIEEAKDAAKVIKMFCNTQSDCHECKIHTLCDSEPYSWEV